MTALTADSILAQIPQYAALVLASRTMGEPLWIVGGCVRDLLLGHAPYDIDIATADPEPIARKFAGLIGGRVVPMDSERGIWRVTQGQASYFDFCRFRAHDITGDLHGRDFTINAIAIRLPNSAACATFVDPFQGQRDIIRQIIRAVTPQAFTDDPVRILRAFRFLAEYHFTIESETWKTMQRDADGLSRVAVERILAEWWKICQAPFTVPALRHLVISSIFPTLFPELPVTPGSQLPQLAVLKKMSELLAQSQGELARWKEHFQSFFAQTPRRKLLIFLALLSDINAITSQANPQPESDLLPLTQLCTRLKVSRDDTAALLAISHAQQQTDTLYQASQQHPPTPLELINYADAVHENIHAILLLNYAKRLTTGTKEQIAVYEQFMRILLDFYQQQYLPAERCPLLKGHDLIKTLHLPPGPLIGALLHEVRNRQIMGEFSTRKEAMQWVKQCLGSKTNTG